MSKLNPTTKATPKENGIVWWGSVKFQKSTNETYLPTMKKDVDMIKVDF